MHLHSFSTFVYFFTCSTLALSAALTRKVDLPVKALRPRPVPSLITSNINTAAVKYSVNIIDTQGNDATDKLTILSNHPSTSGLSKRDRPRPLTACPRGFFFVNSFCVPWRSLKAYTINCMSLSLRQSLYTEKSECSAYEICIGGRAPGNIAVDSQIAYCTSTSNFLPVAETGLENFKQGLTLWGSPVTEGNEIVEAIVATGEDFSAPVNATSMQLTADSVHELFGAESYTTLSGGLSACRDCSAVAIQPVPVGATHIGLNVVLKLGTVGTLFMAWVTP
ncbi:hypothetical protein MMC20_005618 [Loxospora ochrophaea]|nr:hypothetical protein [Loxospora ochrophaea]